MHVLVLVLLAKLNCQRLHSFLFSNRLEQQLLSLMCLLTKISHDHASKIFPSGPDRTAAVSDNRSRTALWCTELLLWHTLAHLKSVQTCSNKAVPLCLICHDSSGDLVCDAFLCQSQITVWGWDKTHSVSAWFRKYVGGIQGRRQTLTLCFSAAKCPGFTGRLTHEVSLWILSLRPDNRERFRVQRCTRLDQLSSTTTLWSYCCITIHPSLMGP